MQLHLHNLRFALHFQPCCIVKPSSYAAAVPLADYAVALRMINYRLVQNGAAPPPFPMPAPCVQRGVCIVNSEAENAVDATAIRGLGYKLRTSPSCLPSLLVTGKGGTFAFVLLDEQRNEKTWERCLA